MDEASNEKNNCRGVWKCDEFYRNNFGGDPWIYIRVGEFLMIFQICSICYSSHTSIFAFYRSHIIR